MMNAGPPYSVFRALLPRLCGIAGAESLDEQREKLVLRGGKHLQSAERRQTIEFLSEPCAVPFPAESNWPLPSACHDPKIMSDPITAAVLDFLRAEVTEQLVLLLLEDLH